MMPLLRAYLQICLLRLGPQDLPASAFLLQLAAVAMLASGTLMLALDLGALIPALLGVLLDMVASAALLYLGLQVIGQLPRFVQSLSAIYGTAALLQLVAIPILLLIGDNPGESVLAQLAVLLYLGLLMLSLAILGHILSNTFDMPMWGGVMLAISYWLLFNSLLGGLGIVS
jgi:hypothetical protein